MSANILLGLFPVGRRSSEHGQRLIRLAKETNPFTQVVEGIQPIWTIYHI